MRKRPITQAEKQRAMPGGFPQGEAPVHPALQRRTFDRPVKPSGANGVVPESADGTHSERHVVVSRSRSPSQEASLRRNVEMAIHHRYGGVSPERRRDDHPATCMKEAFSRSPSASTEPREPPSAAFAPRIPSFDEASTLTSTSISKQRPSPMFRSTSPGPGTAHIRDLSRRVHGGSFCDPPQSIKRIASTSPSSSFCDGPPGPGQGHQIKPSGSSATLGDSGIYPPGTIAHTMAASLRGTSSMRSKSPGPGLGHIRRVDPVAIPKEQMEKAHGIGDVHPTGPTAIFRSRTMRDNTSHTAAGELGPYDPPPGMADEGRLKNTGFAMKSHSPARPERLSRTASVDYISRPGMGDVQRNRPQASFRSRTPQASGHIRLSAASHLPLMRST
eukprot:Sspe_Gene.55755::Locus_30662_Transcript_1_1_Confidence_1.000_Length_2507::g.55755::m.55755